MRTKNQFAGISEQELFMAILLEEIPEYGGGLSSVSLRKPNRKKSVGPRKFKE